MTHRSVMGDLEAQVASLERVVRAYLRRRGSRLWEGLPSSGRARRQVVHARLAVRRWARDRLVEFFEVTPEELDGS